MEVLRDLSCCVSHNSMVSFSFETLFRYLAYSVLGSYDKMKSLIMIKHGWSCASAFSEQTAISLCAWGWGM